MSATAMGAVFVSVPSEVGWQVAPLEVGERYAPSEVGDRYAPLVVGERGGPTVGSWAASLVVLNA